MRTGLAMTGRRPETRVRAAGPGDLAALLALENAVFAGDRMSRRSLRRLLASPSALTLVGEQDGRMAGYALVLFRRHAMAARLYSLAVDPEFSGRGVASALLDAAEAAAWRRESLVLRLEVHVDNAPAIALYRKRGYREIGRRARYYEDGGDALRFEHRLHRIRPSDDAPPYFHQTTEFTCGPACALMALAWGNPAFRRDPVLEFQLWREATTIFMYGGPGGCEPFGLAVALARRGLEPEIHVSAAGPYFLDSVRNPDNRRVMRLSQEAFRRQAADLRIPTHLTPISESGLMAAIDGGAVALVLVSSYRIHRRGVPHWVFVYGRDGRRVLVHDPAAKRDDRGGAVATESHAVPWNKFGRMMRCGPGDLRAAIVIRKGSLQ